MVGAALKGLGKAFTKAGRSLSKKGRSMQKSKLPTSSKYGSHKYKTRSTPYHKTTPIERHHAESNSDYMKRLSKYNWDQKRKREKREKISIAARAAAVGARAGAPVGAGVGAGVGYAVGKRKKKEKKD